MLCMFRVLDGAVALSLRPYQQRVIVHKLQASQRALIGIAAGFVCLGLVP